MIFLHNRFNLHGPERGISLHVKKKCIGNCIHFAFIFSLKSVMPDNE